MRHGQTHATRNPSTRPIRDEPSRRPESTRASAQMGSCRSTYTGVRARVRAGGEGVCVPRRPCASRFRRASRQRSSTARGAAVIRAPHTDGGNSTGDTDSVSSMGVGARADRRVGERVGGWVRVQRHGETDTRGRYRSGSHACRHVVTGGPRRSTRPYGRCTRGRDGARVGAHTDAVRACARHAAASAGGVGVFG